MSDVPVSPLAEAALSSPKKNFEADKDLEAGGLQGAQKGAGTGGLIVLRLPVIEQLSPAEADDRRKRLDWCFHSDAAVETAPYAGHTDAAGVACYDIDTGRAQAIQPLAALDPDFIA